MDEATEICWYCKGEPRFSATSFCGVCYGTGFAPRSTRIRAEFATGPMIVEAPCRSCAALRAELKEALAWQGSYISAAAQREELYAELQTLRGKLRELDAWLDVWLAKQVDVYHNFRSQYAEGVFNAYDNTKKRLRELGLITEARDGE